MKNVTIYLVAVYLLTGCARHNPQAAPTGPDTTPLRPVQVISLLPDIPEPSDIAWNRKNNSLLVVSDAKADIFEIGFDGVVRKTIPVSGADLEGVAASHSGDTLYVAEERKQLVKSFDTEGRQLNSFPVKVATTENNALEGVAVDSRGHLWVLNEKEPRLLLEFKGTQELGRIEITHARDLSGICTDDSGDALWIISDESRKIIKISRSGALLAEWLLPFDKGEGIALVGNKMYVVNDQDAKLYVFEKPQ